MDKKAFLKGYLSKNATVEAPLTEESLEGVAKKGNTFKTRPAPAQGVEPAITKVPVGNVKKAVLAQPVKRNTAEMKYSKSAQIDPQPVPPIPPAKPTVQVAAR